MKEITNRSLSSAPKSPVVQQSNLLQNSCFHKLAKPKFTKTIILYMIMVTIYRAWIHPCCNSMLIALEWPQSSSWSFLSLTVRAGYVCVAIIHRTLTWTPGSLSCAQMLMHAIAHRAVWTPKESLHWKLTLGRKSLAAPGNQACVEGLTVRCSYQLSYILSHIYIHSSQNFTTGKLSIYALHCQWKRFVTIFALKPCNTL